MAVRRKRKPARRRRKEYLVSVKRALTLCDDIPRSTFYLIIFPHLKNVRHLGRRTMLDRREVLSQYREQAR